jgi:hypothetical protein
MTPRCRVAAWLAPIVVAGTAGCTGVAVDPLGMKIVEDVSPVQPMVIEKVCVQINTGVREAFTDGVFETLRSLGLKTQSMQTAFAGECPYWLRYDATWDGFPAYLVRSRVEVFHGNHRLGQVRYDASDGGGRPDRYGSAVGKVRPLIEGMFHHVVEESAEAE